MLEHAAAAGIPARHGCATASDPGAALCGLLDGLCHSRAAAAGAGAATYAVPAPLRADRSAFPRTQRQPAKSRKLDGAVRPRHSPRAPVGVRRGGRPARSERLLFHLKHARHTARLDAVAAPRALLRHYDGRMAAADALPYGRRRCPSVWPPPVQQVRVRAAAPGMLIDRAGEGRVISYDILRAFNGCAGVVYKDAFVHVGPSPAPSPSQISSGAGRGGAGASARTRSFSCIAVPGLEGR